ncbi:hypothetical protein POTOM_046158 [Populus tomentosa]|uniref:Protein TIC 22, chloroplastic n=1 Tax=Populus tomentosa TaxID=118781 RepID=A0A8X7YFC5_POPTO|nr:hypothetical protein POTOM_046158 [Populus tomentosa]
MEPSKPSNPLLSLSTVIHQHCSRLGAEFSARVSDTTRFLAGNFPPPSRLRLAPSPPFASVSQPKQTANTANLSSEHVAKSLAGTAVYTVSNSDNEFVLISDPNGAKSIGLLCFRQEDAEAFLAQVRLRRRELRSQAKVVPITLDQVYMLKVEGIAFRFLPDPVQIKNALEVGSDELVIKVLLVNMEEKTISKGKVKEAFSHLKAAGVRSGFDGVPVFQSDQLIVKKKSKRYCPVYFQKEDIEKELSKVSRASRGPSLSQHIMVGSLEDVLKKMEISEKNSGWEDLIFIPPGKSHSQHIQEITKA